MAIKKRSKKKTKYFIKCMTAICDYMLYEIQIESSIKFDIGYYAKIMNIENKKNPCLTAHCAIGTLPLALPDEFDYDEVVTIDHEVKRPYNELVSYNVQSIIHLELDNDVHNLTEVIWDLSIVEFQALFYFRNQKDYPKLESLRSGCEATEVIDNIYRFIKYYTNKPKQAEKLATLLLSKYNYKVKDYISKKNYEK